MAILACSTVWLKPDDTRQAASGLSVKGRFFYADTTNYIGSHIPTRLTDCQVKNSSAEIFIGLALDVDIMHKAFSTQKSLRTSSLGLDPF